MDQVNSYRVEGTSDVVFFKGRVIEHSAVYTGQSSGTTVVNPLFNSSPIPAGSCVVTGQFASTLHITGSETEDLTIVVSLSTNDSFEWVEHGGNAVYEPLQGDTVVDMGIRGMIPLVQ